MFSRNNQSQITYLVPMERDDDPYNYSFFQGFSDSTISKSIILSNISVLPQYIEEFHLQAKYTIPFRCMFGDYRTMLCNFEVAKIIIDNPPTDLIVIFSDKNTRDYCSELALRCTTPLIHVSDSSIDGIIDIKRVSFRVLRREFRKQIRKVNSDERISYYRKLNKRKPKSLNFPKINYPHYQHNILTPNEACLISNKIRYKSSFSLKYQYRTLSTEKVIIETSNTISDIRRHLDIEYRRNDFILSCPSVYSWLYQDRDLIKKLRKKFGKYSSDGYKKLTTRFSGYHPVDHETLMKKYIKEPSVLEAQFIRASELRIFTSIVQILSSQEFCPNIRLPNGFNLIHHLLDQLEDTIKHGNQNIRKKQNRLYTEVLNTYNTCLPTELKYNISKLQKKCLILSDQPIEWMTVDGCYPLALTHEFCRLPTTPGNQFAHISTMQEVHPIPKSALCNILIVRSFQADDPIKNYLENALTLWENNSRTTYDIKYTFIDVADESEMINALEGFNGSLVIFDCHGNHGGRTESGWLKIGEEKVNSWNLYKKVKVPPIVMLSACNTHSIGGSHASVANGFLGSGAISVLATSVPINSVHAANFIGRFVYNLDKLLKFQSEHMIESISWRELTAHTLQLSFLSDIFLGFQDLGYLDEKSQLQAHAEIMQEVITFKNDWHLKIFPKVAELSNLTPEEAKEVYIKELRYSETTAYTHLGRPDLISIINI